MTGVGAEEKMFQSHFSTQTLIKTKNSYPTVMRKKQILSERKSGDAAMIYINSSSDEDDLVDILTDHGI